MKAQITRKKINLSTSFFLNYVMANARSSLQYGIWLEPKKGKDIFGNLKCKVTFGLEYIDNT